MYTRKRYKKQHWSKKSRARKQKRRRKTKRVRRRRRYWGGSNAADIVASWTDSQVRQRVAPLFTPGKPITLPIAKLRAMMTDVVEKSLEQKQVQQQEAARMRAAAADA